MTLALNILRIVAIILAFILCWWAFFEKDFTRATFWLVIFYANLYGQRD